jgi:hypothetical protein
MDIATPTPELIETGQKAKKNGEAPKIEADIHRRILNFINEAVHPEDLMYEKISVHDAEAHQREEGHDFQHEQKKPVMDFETAKKILDFRDLEYPLGIRNIRELTAVKLIDRRLLETLLERFSNILFGKWSVFPQTIPRRGPGGYDGIIHAALLYTGQVLFITADETTLLWDPENDTASTWENPVNQPHLMPGGYSQLCGHHVFLSDGKLLSVGGGGYGHNSLARWGYKFDPVTKAWSRTSNAMEHSRWYPTLVKLGDQRLGNDHQVLVVCGHGGGDMEIYDEGTDTFTHVTGDTKTFPSLYPGLHLLPNHSIFYSRTGWATAGANGGKFPGDDQSAYFTLTGANTGNWHPIAPVAPTMPDRTKGMSVMLLSNTPPYVRVLVVGGSDPVTNNTYEIIDATSLSSASNWGPALPFPDGEHRSLCSAVLLPNGEVFVCGGIQRTNSPCTSFNPQTNTWSRRSALPSVRDYHSAAMLLPNGKVMMAGWNNTSIEIFSPPYLFAGPRPVISVAPSLVHHGQRFAIESPDADSITRITLVRPMAVTHQTDSEQRVIELPFIHDHVRPVRLEMTAPDGGHPHSYAPQGYYMLFAINRRGVPSVAKWIYLH